MNSKVLKVLEFPIIILVSFNPFKKVLLIILMKLKFDSNLAKKCSKKIY